MLETIKKQFEAKAAIGIFLALILWWIFNLVTKGPDAERYFGDFASIYGIMALWGAIWGVVIAQSWGSIKSVMGKAILMFSLGLFAQEFGQIAYAYMAFFKHTEVPYPSIGDIGYFGSIPLYIFGVILLARASGVHLQLRSFSSKLQAVAIPVVMLVISYVIFLQGYEFDWSNPMKIFLDFGYPFGQAIYISLALLTYLLSKKTLGGLMKNVILFILFALFVQFLADYTFLYQSSKGVWFAGGVNDVMYLIAYFLMTLGLLQFQTVAKKLRA